MCSLLTPKSNRFRWNLSILCRCVVVSVFMFCLFFLFFFLFFCVFVLFCCECCPRSGVLCRGVFGQVGTASNCAARSSSVVFALPCRWKVAFFVLFCVTRVRLVVVSIIVYVYSGALSSVTGEYSMYVETNNQ